MATGWRLLQRDDDFQEEGVKHLAGWDLRFGKKSSQVIVKRDRTPNRGCFPTRGSNSYPASRFVVPGSVGPGWETGEPGYRLILVRIRS